MFFLLVFAAHRLFGHDAPIAQTITAQNGIAIAFTQPMAKKRPSTKRSSAKRDLVKSRTGKSFAKRTGKGRFKEMDRVKRSLSGDRRKKAKRKVKSGYGDQGDR